MDSVPTPQGVENVRQLNMHPTCRFEPPRPMPEPEGHKMAEPFFPQRGAHARPTKGFPSPAHSPTLTFKKNEEEKPSPAEIQNAQCMGMNFTEGRFEWEWDTPPQEEIKKRLAWNPRWGYYLRPMEEVHVGNFWESQSPAKELWAGFFYLWIYWARIFISKNTIYWRHVLGQDIDEHRPLPKDARLSRSRGTPGESLEEVMQRVRARNRFLEQLRGWALRLRGGFEDTDDLLEEFQGDLAREMEEAMKLRGHADAGWAGTDGFTKPKPTKVGLMGELPELGDVEMLCPPREENWPYFLRFEGSKEQFREQCLDLVLNANEYLDIPRSVENETHTPDDRPLWGSRTVFKHIELYAKYESFSWYHRYCAKMHNDPEYRRRKEAALGISPEEGAAEGDEEMGGTKPYKAFQNMEGLHRDDAEAWFQEQERKAREEERAERVQMLRAEGYEMASDEVSLSSDEKEVEEDSESSLDMTKITSSRVNVVNGEVTPYVPDKGEQKRRRAQGRRGAQKRREGADEGEYEWGPGQDPVLEYDPVREEKLIDDLMEQAKEVENTAFGGCDVHQPNTADMLEFEEGKFSKEDFTEVMNLLEEYRQTGDESKKAMAKAILDAYEEEMGKDPKSDLLYGYPFEEAQSLAKSLYQRIEEDEMWAETQFGTVDEQALWQTACYGMREAMKLILDDGVDVNAMDGWGRTALHHVCLLGMHNGSCISTLIKHGADLNAQDDSGWTPLCRAVFWGHYYSAKRLLDAGANVELETLGLRRAIHWATYAGHLSCVELLLEYGARIDTEDEEGMLPYQIARQRGFNETMKLLDDTAIRMEQEERRKFNEEMKKRPYKGTEHEFENEWMNPEEPPGLSRNISKFLNWYKNDVEMDLRVLDQSVFKDAGLPPEYVDLQYKSQLMSQAGWRRLVDKMQSIEAKIRANRQARHDAKVKAQAEGRRALLPSTEETKLAVRSRSGALQHGSKRVSDRKGVDSLAAQEQHISELRKKLREAEERLADLEPEIANSHVWQNKSKQGELEASSDESSSEWWHNPLYKEYWPQSWDCRRLRKPPVYPNSTEWKEMSWDPKLHKAKRAVKKAAEELKIAEEAKKIATAKKQYAWKKGVGGNRPVGHRGRQAADGQRWAGGAGRREEREGRQARGGDGDAGGSQDEERFGQFVGPGGFVEGVEED